MSRNPPLTDARAPLGRRMQLAVYATKLRPRMTRGAVARALGVSPYTVAIVELQALFKLALGLGWPLPHVPGHLRAGFYGRTLRCSVPGCGAFGHNRRTCPVLRGEVTRG